MAGSISVCTGPAGGGQILPGSGVSAFTLVSSPAARRMFSESPGGMLGAALKVWVSPRNCPNPEQPVSDSNRPNRAMRRIGKGSSR
jgi:energy-converting hydrogenase Eha subunit B